MKLVTRWEKRGDLYLLWRNGWKRGVIWREGRTWFGVAPFGEASLAEISGFNLISTKRKLVESCKQVDL